MDDTVSRTFATTPNDTSEAPLSGPIALGPSSESAVTGLAVAEPGLTETPAEASAATETAAEAPPTEATTETEAAPVVVAAASGRPGIAAEESGPTETIAEASAPEVLSTTPGPSETEAERSDPTDLAATTVVATAPFDPTANPAEAPPPCDPYRNGRGPADSGRSAAILDPHSADRSGHGSTEGPVGLPWVPRHCPTDRARGTRPAGHSHGTEEGGGARGPRGGGARGPREGCAATGHGRSGQRWKRGDGPHP